MMVHPSPDRAVDKLSQSLHIALRRPLLQDLFPSLDIFPSIGLLPSLDHFAFLDIFPFLDLFLSFS